MWNFGYFNKGAMLQYLWGQEGRTNKANESDQEASNIVWGVAGREPTIRGEGQAKMYEEWAHTTNGSKYG